jgi:hypothetical protein
MPYRSDISATARIAGAALRLAVGAAAATAFAVETHDHLRASFIALGAILVAVQHVVSKKAIRRVTLAGTTFFSVMAFVVYTDTGFVCPVCDEHQAHGDLRVAGIPFRLWTVRYGDSLNQRVARLCGCPCSHERLRDNPVDVVEWRGIAWRRHLQYGHDAFRPVDHGKRLVDDGEADAIKRAVAARSVEVATLCDAIKEQRSISPDAWIEVVKGPQDQAMPHAIGE